MSIETRLSNLEKRVNALINYVFEKNFINDSDKGAIRDVESIHGIEISENDTAICDVADLSDVNSQAIDDLAELVDELSNKVAEMEG